jgi:hypothetical protein
MTPEQFIQDHWNGSTTLKAAVPIANVITGEHNRLASTSLPCANLTVTSEQQRYATNDGGIVWRASVRVQCWAVSIARIVQIKDAVRDELHRASWSGTGYKVGLCTVDSQYWTQQEDGEYQGIHELEITYSET